MNLQICCTLLSFYPFSQLREQKFSKRKGKFKNFVVKRNFWDIFLFKLKKYISQFPPSPLSQLEVSSQFKPSFQNDLIKKQALSYRVECIMCPLSYPIKVKCQQQNIFLVARVLQNILPKFKVESLTDPQQNEKIYYYQKMLSSSPTLTNDKHYLTFLPTFSFIFHFLIVVKNECYIQI